MSGSSHLGKRIVKDLGGTLSHGMVVAYFPKTAEETEVWRVLYTDGTEEDVSEDGLDAFEPINQSKCSSVLQGVAKEWSDIQRKSREKGKEGRKNSERNSPQFDSDSEDNVPLVRRVAGSTGTAASDSLGTNVSGLGGYHIFMSAQLRQLRAEVPSSTRAEKFMRISALWRGMSAEEKEKYAGVARRIIQKRARLAEGEDLGQPSANKKRRAESKSAAATPRNSDARLSPPGAIAQTPEKEAAQDDTEEEDTEEDTPLLTRVAGPCGGQIVASTDDTTKQHGSGSLDKEMRATAEDGGQRASDERSESAPAVHGRRPWSEGLEEGGERIPRTADACAEQTRVHERHHEKVGQPEGEDGSNGARGISASSFPREMQERRAAGVFPQGEGRRDGGDVCDEVGASEGGPASPPPQARPALAGGALPVGEHSRPQSQGKMCEHGRQRSRCKECGGAAICEHGRVRSYCKECGGSAICEHNRQRSRCKECGWVRKPPSLLPHPRKVSRQSTVAGHERIIAAEPRRGAASLCAVVSSSGLAAGDRSFILVVDEEWGDEGGFQLVEVCGAVDGDGKCEAREWYPSVQLGSTDGQQKFLPVSAQFKCWCVKPGTALAVEVTWHECAKKPKGHTVGQKYVMVVQEQAMVGAAYTMLRGKMPQPDSNMKQEPTLDQEHVQSTMVTSKRARFSPELRAGESKARKSLYRQGLFRPGGPGEGRWVLVEAGAEKGAEKGAGGQEEEGSGGGARQAGAQSCKEHVCKADDTCVLVARKVGVKAEDILAMNVGRCSAPCERARVVAMRALTCGMLLLDTPGLRSVRE